jgi:hypothetical protein
MSSNFNTLLPTLNKFLDFICKRAFLFLLKPLAYCILAFFIRTKVLALEIFLQFGEQVEITRSKIWAVTGCGSTVNPKRAMASVVAALV